MATLPGRIRRISLDAGNPVNYGIFSTSAYDVNRPAATQDYWAPEPYELTAMDQSLSLTAPAAVEVPNQGAFIYFERFPYLFTGVIAKIRPTYDYSAGEDPYFEMWTYNPTLVEGVPEGWRLRSRVQLASGFVGCPSGKLKYFDFRLAVPLENVTQVWVTMDPGKVGTPTNSFMAIHCFGRCMNDPIIDGKCENDPTIACIDPGCESDLETCLTPLVDCINHPDLCRIPPFDDPGGPPIPDPIPPPPPIDLPPGPDLCDPVAVAAFKLTLNPEQLAYFEDMLANNEFVCLTDPDKVPQKDPPINPGPEPKLWPKQPTEEEPTDADTPSQGPQIPVGGPQWQDYDFHFFFWPNAAARTGFIAHVADAGNNSFPELAAIRDAWNHVNIDEPVTEVYPHTNLNNGLQFDVTGISYHDQVKVTSYQRQPTYDGGGLVVYPLRFVPAVDGTNAGSYDALFNATITSNLIWRWLLESDAPLSDFGASVRDQNLVENAAEMLLTNSHSASFRAKWNGCSAQIWLDGSNIVHYANPGPACPMTDDPSVGQPYYQALNDSQQFYFKVTVRRLLNNFSVSSSVPGPQVKVSII